MFSKAEKVELRLDRLETEAKQDLPQRSEWLRRLLILLLFFPILPYVIYKGLQHVKAWNEDDADTLYSIILQKHAVSKLFRGKNAPLSLISRSQRAYMTFVNGNLEKSQNLFSALRQKTHASDKEKDRFIKYHAQHWLAIIRGDPVQAKYEAEQAQKLSYQTSSLWIPDYSQDDEIEKMIDREFFDAAQNAKMTPTELIRHMVKK